MKVLASGGSFELNSFTGGFVANAISMRLIRCSFSSHPKFTFVSIKKFGIGRCPMGSIEWYAFSSL